VSFRPVVRPRKLFLRDGHVEGDVDDAVLSGLAKVGELDDTGDLEARFGDVDPEVGADGTVQLEDDADNADVVDGIVAFLPFLREIGDERGDLGGRGRADDGVGWKPNRPANHRIRRIPIYCICRLHPLRRSGTGVKYECRSIARRRAWTPRSAG